MSRSLLIALLLFVLTPAVLAQGFPPEEAIERMKVADGSARFISSPPNR
jgi:hypothetical protein